MMALFLSIDRALTFSLTFDVDAATLCRHT
jgi:hypothetical protein